MNEAWTLAKQCSTSKKHYGGAHSQLCAAGYCKHTRRTSESCFFTSLLVALAQALMCRIITVQVVPILGGLVALAMFIAPMNAVWAHACEIGELLEHYSLLRFSLFIFLAQRFLCCCVALGQPTSLLGCRFCACGEHVSWGCDVLATTKQPCVLLMCLLLVRLSACGCSLSFLCAGAELTGLSGDCG